MARSDIKAGAAYVELWVKRSAFDKALRDASKRLQDFGVGIMKVGAGFAAMGGGIIGSLTGAVMHFAKTGDELDKMSLRTGVASGALAELGFAAEQSGSDLGTVESALQRMQKNIGGIGPESIKTTAALEAIGLSVESIRSMSPEDQFQEIAERVGDIQDPAKRAATAMAVFGSGGRQLLPMLENIRELRAEARELGIAPSPESVAAAAQITDAINRVRRVIGATIFEIGAAVAPMAMDVLDSFLNIVSAVRKFIVANKPLITQVAKIGAIMAVVGAAVMAVGAAFVGAGLILSGVAAAVAGFSAAIGLVVSVVSAVGAAIGLLFTPVGIVVALLAGAVVAFFRFTDAGKEASSKISTSFSSLLTTFQSVRDRVMSVFGSIRDAIASGDLALAGRIAMTALRLAFFSGLDALSAVFGSGMTDLFGSLVSQILSGDLTGAWNTVVAGLSQVWWSFSQGIVTRFVDIAGSVIRVWRETVDSIVNYILNRAKEGGVFGAAFKMISGVDVANEFDRNEQLKAQTKDSVKNNIQSIINEVDAELQVAVSIGDQTAIDRLTEELDRAKNQLDELENADMPDIFDEVTAGTYSDPATEAAAARAANALDLLQREVDRAKEEADQAVDQATTTRANSEVSRLESELAELQRQAAESKKKADEEAEERERAIAEGQEVDEQQKGQASAATASAAAFMAQASGAGSEQRDILTELQQDRKEKRQRYAEERQARIDMLFAMNSLKFGTH